MLALAQWEAIARLQTICDVSERRACASGYGGTGSTFSWKTQLLLGEQSAGTGTDPGETTVKVDFGPD